MRTYYVGITMRSADHDYAPVEAALRLLHGQKVSERIWRCEVAEAVSDYLFALTRLCLSESDEMVVEPVPAEARVALAA